MKALILFLVLPLHLLSQDLSGIWKGYMETRGNNLQFELLISDINDNVTGYALTVFTINGTDNIGIKSIKLKKKNGVLTIEDNEMVFNNYATPPKRFKQFSTLRADGHLRTLSGDFRTKSLDFRADDNAYSGTILLKKQNDSTRTKLIEKLDELNLLDGFAFIPPAPDKKEEIIAAAVPQEKPKISSVSQQETGTTKTTPSVDVGSFKVKEAAVIAPPKVKPEDVVVKEEKVLVQEEKTKSPVTKETGETIVEPRSWNIKETPAVSASKPKQDEVVKKEVTASTSLPDEKLKNTSPTAKETETKTLAVETKPQIVKETPGATVPTKKLESASKIAAAEIATRKTEIIRSVPIMADSIILSLYDNGIVDGDTVSVVLNGRVIIAKEQLTTTPIRAVVYLTPDLGDSMQLVMYAENMGSIAPNTGLLFVQDGANRYEIRFEGDMKKSSAIVLRRRR